MWMKKPLLFVLLLVFVLTLSIISIFYDATHSALSRLQINRVTLSDNSIPQSLDDTKIIYFSDLHLFANDNNEFIASVFDQMAQEEADIILFGGDFIDASLSNLNDNQLSFIDEQLNKLNPNLGFFAVLGQDDAIHLEELNAIYQKHNIEILENKAVLIRNQSSIGIQLFGYHGLTSSLENLDSSLYTLAFMYDPSWMSDLNSSSIDVVLAAKTHGGQINLPLFKPSYSRATGTYISGDQIVNNHRLIISNGISTLEYQARFFRDPSIYIFTLKQK